MSRKKDGAGPSVTRRSFIKGAGITAAGTAILETGLLGQGAVPAGPKVQGPDAVSITLNINGKPTPVQAEPRTTLAEVLRGPANLTGTKVVCDRGSCSACTVLIDGTPVNSCMTFALDIGNRKVTTIEGLLAGNEMHPVQAAFVEHDGMQCGYCTSGMVMSCAALLQRNASPTEQDVREAIRGNLCRCGTYPKVVEATLAAANAPRARKGARA